MRIGTHLPRYGRVAGPDAIQRAARHAEQLGFADVWVSDHVVHPSAQDQHEGGRAHDTAGPCAVLENTP
jgi:alkanesulfonate monooxygenase SsuD/methylene tetrahydromethanopterin reductase-like flavin-dependent oxidoreductase (luciferase family)